MSFFADKQTLYDLNIGGKYKPDSVFALFSSVVSVGGLGLLEELFQQPMKDVRQINRQSEMFAWFGQEGLQFPFTKEQLATVEEFLDEGKGGVISMGTRLGRQRLLSVLVRDEEYGIAYQRVCTVMEVLRLCREWLPGVMKCPLLEKESERLGSLLADNRLKPDGGQPGFWRVVHYTSLLRGQLLEDMVFLLKVLYRIDVGIAVGRTAMEKGFCYAKAVTAEAGVLSLKGLRHPRLPGGVGNDLSFRADSNVLFLTGANMAGKSTLMKAWGLAVYLAHMGFPVAAESMVFSVLDGIYSSINVPDNIAQGYSHFYAEVLRVKTVAEAVAAGQRLAVIFDELFKGTNVKDAYDGTLTVVEGFAAYRESFFVVSTHITEVGEVLRERCGNCRFTYLPALMEGNQPRYTYRMKEGITVDRQGMVIIANEGILKLLEL